MSPLQGKIAVVAGATRGAGRGIACALGEAGATVYCTGRSVRGKPATSNHPETIVETAEMVTPQGGVGIYARVDHTVEDQVETLFERVCHEQGQLDVDKGLARWWTWPIMFPDILMRNPQELAADFCERYRTILRKKT